MDECGRSLCGGGEWVGLLVLYGLWKAIENWWDARQKAKAKAIAEKDKQQQAYESSVRVAAEFLKRQHPEFWDELRQRPPAQQVKRIDEVIALISETNALVEEMQRLAKPDETEADKTRFEREFRELSSRASENYQRMVRPIE